MKLLTFAQDFLFGPLPKLFVYHDLQTPFFRKWRPGLSFSKSVYKVVYKFAHLFYTVFSERSRVKGAAMKVYKYIRVSTKAQGSRFGLDRQRHELNKAYPDAIEVVDEISGAKKERPGLDSLLSMVESGDKIVCVSLDRLGRNTADILSLVEELRTKGVSVHLLKENIDTSNNDAFTNFFITMLSAFAQLEREQMLERQAMTKEAMKAEGKNIGRPRTDSAKIEAAITLVNEGKSYREVSEIVGICPATICKAMKQYRAENAFQE